MKIEKMFCVGAKQSGLTYFTICLFDSMIGNKCLHKCFEIIRNQRSESHTLAYQLYIIVGLFILSLKK